MWHFFYYVTCHNFGPSLTIIVDSDNKYLEKKIISNFFHNATCQILINGWQLMTLIWHHGCKYNGVA
jgi:hypothetical protein